MAKTSPKLLPKKSAGVGAIYGFCLFIACIALTPMIYSIIIGHSPSYFEAVNLVTYALPITFVCFPIASAFILRRQHFPHPWLYSVVGGIITYMLSGLLLAGSVLYMNGSFFASTGIAIITIPLLWTILVSSLAFTCITWATRGHRLPVTLLILLAAILDLAFVWYKLVYIPSTAIY